MRAMLVTTAQFKAGAEIQIPIDGDIGIRRAHEMHTNFYGV